MHCFSDYENYPSDSTLLHDEMVDFARWLCDRSLNAEEYSEYNVSDFSPVGCAAAWKHIKAGRITYWIDYGADPIGIEEYVEFVGFKDNSRQLAEWLKEEINRASNSLPTDEKTKPSTPRLMVDLACKTVTLDGTKYDVSSDNALRWVKVLADHPGEWISGSELTKYDSDLIVRTDRLKRFLPPQVLALIEQRTGAGSRIRL